MLELKIHMQPVVTSKPSQAKVLTGAETCAKRKSTSPCLLAIPVFDRVAGLYDRHLNYNRGNMLTLTVWSQAEGLDRLNKRLVLMGHCT